MRDLAAQTNALLERRWRRTPDSVLQRRRSSLRLLGIVRMPPPSRRRLLGKKTERLSAQNIHLARARGFRAVGAAVR